MRNFLTFLGFLTGLSSFAASGGMGGNGNNPPAPRGGVPPPGLPIDQYLLPLFVAGILVFIIYRRKKSLI